MNKPTRYHTVYLREILPNESYPATETVVLASDYDKSTQLIQELTDQLNRIRLEHEELSRAASEYLRVMNHGQQYDYAFREKIQEWLEWSSDAQEALARALPPKDKKIPPEAS